jgi:predicted ATPase
VAGDTYVGLDVHRAARIAAAGHGGQILLSEATRALAEPDLPAGALLRDLGEFRLKDLQRPEHLAQLVLPGLPADFPPLKTLDRLPNNLPIMLTPLLGRDRELAHLRGLLLQPEVRLVSLLGPGGAGKTSLALQLAADLSSAFPDGVYFIALHAVRDGALVVPTIVHTLGVHEGAGESLAETLRRFVREKRLLLILDNVEQIIEPVAAAADDFLKAAPHLKLLVTSRAPLRVSGEREYPVPPLGLPDPRHLPAMDDLAACPSVQLFTQRAVAARPDFALTSANARAVAQVCVLLDGLPLALELAAARVKVLPPPALAQRLAPAQSGAKGGGRSARLSLLTGGARDLPARQQTLTDTLAWSYDLLTDEERALYRRLAVFVEGWTLEAAEAVVPAGGALALDVLDGLAALVDKSLIRQQEESGDDSGRDAAVRFGMLQVIREFGLLRLEEAGEAAAVREAHARYFLTRAQEVEAPWWTAESPAWSQRLEREHENLLAALAWARDEHQVALGLRLAGVLDEFWTSHGYLTEGRTWLTTLLALETNEAGTPNGADPAVHAQALIALGGILSYQRDYPAAEPVLEEALALSRTIGDRRMVAFALCWLGLAAAAQHDHERADALMTEMLALAREHVATGTLWQVVFET